MSMNTRIAHRLMNAVPTRHALLLAASVSVACSAQDAGTAPSATVETQESAIIGGMKAQSAALDVVGALVYFDPYYGVSELCTATLLNAETALTARHCVDVLDDLLFYGYGSAYLAIGPDSAAPDQLLQVALVETPRHSFGGFVGMGVDVAVVHLADPAVGEFNYPNIGDSSDIVVGESLVSVGYGVYSAGYAFDGKRRIGRETVTATSGLTFGALLGDFESFVEWWFTGETTEENILTVLEELGGYESYWAEELRRLHQIYVAYELIPGGEMVAGQAPKDTQSCYGDSGGPMMRFEQSGAMTVFGVVSGGLNSRRSACDYGGVYATFDSEVVSFLQASKEWEDPCGAVPESGTCSDSATLSFCRTAIIAGIRELATTDCGALGLACEENEYGAGCGAAPEPPPAPESDAGASEENLEPVLDVQEMLADRYYPASVASRRKAW